MKHNYDLRPRPRCLQCGVSQQAALHFGWHTCDKAISLDLIETEVGWVRRPEASPSTSKLQQMTHGEYPSPQLAAQHPELIAEYNQGSQKAAPPSAAPTLDEDVRLVERALEWREREGESVVMALTRFGVRASTLENLLDAALRAAVPSDVATLTAQVGQLAAERDEARAAHMKALDERDALLRAAAPSSGEPLPDTIDRVTDHCESVGVHPATVRNLRVEASRLRMVAEPDTFDEAAEQARLGFIPVQGAADPADPVTCRNCENAEEAGHADGCPDSVMGAAESSGALTRRVLRGDASALAEPVQDDALLEWLEQRADDERRAAASARRYADWLETPEAESVPPQARFGNPDDNRDDADAHDATAELYERVAARLRTVPSEPDAWTTAEEVEMLRTRNGGRVKVGNARVFGERVEGDIAVYFRTAPEARRTVPAAPSEAPND